MDDTPLSIRIVLLTVLAASVAAIAFKIGVGPALLPLPGAKSLVAEAVVLFAIYACVVAWPSQKRILRPLFAARIGAIGCLVQIAHVATERFCSLPSRWDAATSLIAMLATFLLWGYVAFRAGRAGSRLFASVWYATWSAIVTMTFAMYAGIMLELYLAPYPLEPMRQWAEFQRSGWSDLAAFSIANTIDSASSHLLLGPVVAAIVGSIAFALSRPGNRHLKTTSLYTPRLGP